MSDKALQAWGERWHAAGSTWNIGQREGGMTKKLAMGRQERDLRLTRALLEIAQRVVPTFGAHPAPGEPDKRMTPSADALALRQVARDVLHELDGLEF